jgi:hypothetical protein
MGVLEGDAIGRLTLRGSITRSEARAFADQVADTDLARVPRRSILLVERLGARLQAGRHGAIRDTLEVAIAEVWRDAAAPWAGAPADARAVRFADEIELLTAYARDAALGVTERWWWRLLSDEIRPDVYEILATHPRSTPAVLGLLGRSGAAGLVVRALSAGQAADLAWSVAVVHGAGVEAARRATTTVPSGAAADVPDDLPAPHRWLLVLCASAVAAPGRVPRLVAEVAGAACADTTSSSSNGVAPSHNEDRSARRAVDRSDPPAPAAATGDDGGPTASVRSRPDAAAVGSLVGDVEVARGSGAEGGPASTSAVGIERAVPALPGVGSNPVLGPDPAERRDRRQLADRSAAARSIGVAAHGPAPAQETSASGEDASAIGGMHGAPAGSPLDVTSTPGAAVSAVAGVLHLVALLDAVETEVELGWAVVDGVARWLLFDASDDLWVDTLWRLLADLHEHDDRDVTALGEHVGPLVATELERRLGRHTDAPITALLRRTGEVAVTSSHVDVTFPLVSIWLPARLAGLDVDPGWVPWLGRVVLFHYE